MLGNERIFYARARTPRKGNGDVHLSFQNGNFKISHSASDYIILLPSPKSFQRRRARTHTHCYMAVGKVSYALSRLIITITGFFGGRTSISRLACLRLLICKLLAAMRPSAQLIFQSKYTSWCGSIYMRVLRKQTLFF